MKYWIITGISSGLGKALAETVMKRKDFVIGTFRKEEQVAAFNKQFKNKGKAFLLELSDENSIKQFVQEVKEAFSTVDVLVNNAGMGFIGAIEESSMQEIREVFNVNFFGTLLLTKEILPLFRKQKNGHLIQISSHGGIKAFAGFGIYNASKFALEGFSEALAQEIAPLGIHLSIVEPGPFRTNFAGIKLGEAQHQIADYAATAGIFRKKLKEVHGMQEGDPLKAANAIIQLSSMAEPLLRMPLGKVALVTIPMKLESVRQDLEKSRWIAEKAIF